MACMVEADRELEDEPLASLKIAEFLKTKCASPLLSPLATLFQCTQELALMAGGTGLRTGMGYSGTAVWATISKSTTETSAISKETIHSRCESIYATAALLLTD